MQSLDSILKGEKPTEVVEQPKPEVPEVAAEAPETEEAKAQRLRDDKGRFAAKPEGETPAKPESPKAEAAPKVETKPAPTAAEKPKVEARQDDAEPLDPKAKAYYAKAKDEQRKRQDLERRLAELEARQHPPQKIDPLQDPEGFANRIAQDAENRAFDRILNFSEASARRVYGDELVTEARDAYLEAMRGNPGLYMHLQQQPDPYEYVVKSYKREKFMREVQDPDEWTKQQEAKIRERLEAEYAQKAQQLPVRQAPPTPPPSLANVTSSGRVSSEPAWNGPTPLNNIFRR